LKNDRKRRPEIGSIYFDVGAIIFLAVLVEKFSIEKDDPKSGRCILTLEPLFSWYTNTS
jgi:hypothetical protein